MTKRTKKSSNLLPHSFSDFARDELEEKVALSSIIDRPIVLDRFEILKSKFPKEKNDEYIIIHFHLIDADGTVSKTAFKSSTGSVILRSLCKKYAEQIPFVTTIIKKGNGFKFS